MWPDGLDAAVPGLIRTIYNFRIYWHISGQKRMPDREEVLAALDALWNQKIVRWDYGYRALKRAGMTKLGQLLGRPVSSEPSMGLAKKEFEQEFYSATFEALEAVEHEYEKDKERHQCVEDQLDRTAFTRAALYVLWIHPAIRNLPSMHAKKGDFDANFYSVVHHALEAVQEVKDGKTAREVFKPNLWVEYLGSIKYRVQIALHRDTEPHATGEFRDYRDARAWIRDESGGFLRSHGIDPKTAIVVE